MQRSNSTIEGFQRPKGIDHFSARCEIGRSHLLLDFNRQRVIWIKVHDATFAAISTTQAQRPGPAGARIATRARWQGTAAHKLGISNVLGSPDCPSNQNHKQSR
jgi:hypothetical protein